MSYASDQGVLNAQWNAAQMAFETEIAKQAPHVLMRPSISKDGDVYCLLYGENINDGVCGFGSTPEDAAQDFDKAWKGK